MCLIHALCSVIVFYGCFCVLSFCKRVRAFVCAEWVRVRGVCVFDICADAYEGLSCFLFVSVCILTAPPRNEKTRGAEAKHASSCDWNFSRVRVFVLFGSGQVRQFRAG